MKTPEVNIQDEVQKIHGQFGTSELANYKIQLLFDAQIKSMQEDAEKELIEFAEYYDTLSPVEKCTVHSPNGSGTGLYLKPTKDILTQFRKG